jgi:hypothetical protein
MSEYMKPDEFIKGSWQEESCKKGRLFPRLPSLSREILQQMNQNLEDSRRGKPINFHYSDGRMNRSREIENSSKERQDESRIAHEDESDIVYTVAG